MNVCFDFPSLSCCPVEFLAGVFLVIRRKHAVLSIGPSESHTINNISDGIIKLLSCAFKRLYLMDGNRRVRTVTPLITRQTCMHLDALTDANVRLIASVAH